MKKVILTAIIFALAGFAAGYLVSHGSPFSMEKKKGAEERKILFYRDPMNPQSTSPTPKKAPDGMDFVPVYAEEEKQDGQGEIAYYVDPMHPWYTSDKPGKAPDCGMDLVPVYKGDDKAEGVHIDPSIIQSIGVTTEKAKLRRLAKTVRTSGIVETDESKLYTVTTKYMGWIDKLSVDKTGQDVGKNQVLLSLYSPDLVSSQEEYLLALRYRKSLSDSTLPEIRGEGDAMIKSVLQRLSYWDLPQSEIKAIEKRGTPLKNLAVRSPFKGIVMEKMVTAGDKIEAGMPLYKIADLSTVWVTADVYPSYLPWIRKGQEAEVSLSYIPGKTRKGRVSFIYPYLNDEARTVKVRIEIKNTPQTDYKPGMFTTVTMTSPSASGVVTVPEQAIIRSGTRSIAVVSLGGGYFTTKEIRTGVSSDGYIQVLDGIHEGEIIVTSSQFLIDSESNLRAAVSALTKKETKAAPAKNDEGAKPDQNTSSPEPANVKPTAAPGGHEGHDPGMAGMEKESASMNKPLSAPVKSSTIKNVKGTAKKKSEASRTMDKNEGQHVHDTSSAESMNTMTDQGKQPEKPLKQSGKVIYTCVMHPEIVRDKPGDCPICGMTLVPKE